MDFSIFDSFAARNRREPGRVESDHALATAGHAPFASVLGSASSNADRTADHQSPPGPAAVEEASTDPHPNRVPADETTDIAERSTEGTEETRGEEVETDAVAQEPASDAAEKRGDAVAQESASDTAQERDEADAEDDLPTEQVVAPQQTSTSAQNPSDTQQAIATATEPLATDGDPANANQQPGSSAPEEQSSTASASKSSASRAADPGGHESSRQATTATESAASRGAGTDAAAAKTAASAEVDTVAAAAEPVAASAATEETATPSEGKRRSTKPSDKVDRLQAASSPSGEVQKPDTLAPAASSPPTAADLTAAALGDGASEAGETVTGPKDVGEAGAPSRSIDLPRSFGLSQQGDMHLSSRAAAADSAGELSHVDQTRLLDRVARAIQVAPQRGGVIRLRLNPPELGALQLEVSVQRGTLSARLETETQVARTLLLDNLPQLRDRLAEQGIRIEQFDVQVGARDADHSQQQSDHSRHHQQAPRTAGQGGRQTSVVDTHMASPTLAAVMGPTNLNVVI